MVKIRYFGHFWAFWAVFYQFHSNKYIFSIWSRFLPFFTLCDVLVEHSKEVTRGEKSCNWDIILNKCFLQINVWCAGQQGYAAIYDMRTSMSKNPRA